MKNWTVSDTSNEIEMLSNSFEFQDDKGEWHEFTIIATKEKIIFGGCCNIGFLESGYLEREEYESLEESLQETLADLESYYNYGSGSVSRIVCNERM
jgi:hypothetical protein